jgi:UDP-glucose:(heptosyl)LPS alpha-1,3-glucosyltransferase
MKKRLSTAFVRRGYSSTGGAEAYLKRLAGGVVEAGHQVQLVTTHDWPDAEWPFGPIVRLGGESPIAFANELQRMPSRIPCDVLFSLDRVWTCDVYRAGDGVHRAWLDRRRKFELPLKRFVRNLGSKHQSLLRLEQSLFSDSPVPHVISGSQMVKDEIVEIYGYPPENISIVRNGVPLEKFQFDPEIRTSSRDQLNLKPDQTALLFAGSGWERKGLLFAMEAAALCGDRKMRLLVAGRGNPKLYKTRRLRLWGEESVQFLGEISDMLRVYAAADIFILPTIYDPFSNACLEALACGLPVITTRSNGFSEIIETSIHGSIVDSAGDLAGLRESIRFWSDPARRAAIKSTNVELAGQFSISRNVRETLDILFHAVRGETE